MTSVNPGKAVSRAVTIPAGVQHKLEAVNPGKAISHAADPLVTAAKAAVAPIIKAAERAFTPPGITVPSAVTDSINIPSGAIGAAATAAVAERRNASIRAVEDRAARARGLAAGSGGDTGLALDPLGRRGRGAVGYASLLGR